MGDDKWNVQLSIARVFLAAFVLAMSVTFVALPAAFAEEYEFKTIVIAEDGVPAAFEEDVLRAAKYTELFYKERYGIELEEDARIIITPDRRAYAEARMREGGESREKAERHAAFASGNSIGKTRTILLNAGHAKMQSEPTKRVKTTCHELTHQVQAKLSNNRQSKAGYKWMSEGTANSLAFRIMELAGFSTVEQERSSWLQNLKDTAQLPKVTQVQDNKDWVKLVEEKKNPYALATNMVEFLIDRCGYDAIIDYFKELKERERSVAFQKAFGMAHEDFLQEFDRYYKKEIPNAPK